MIRTNLPATYLATYENALKLTQQKRGHADSGTPLVFMAEREGFEPSKGYKPLPDFESGTFDHSATSPVAPPHGPGA